MSLGEIVDILNKKGYKVRTYNISECSITFAENYAFTTIPKGFIYKDGCIKQVFDFKLNNKIKQYKRDLKFLDKWVKNL